MKLSIFYSLVFSFLIFNLANAEEKLILGQNLILGHELILGQELILACENYKDVSVKKTNELRNEGSHFDYKDIYSYFDVSGKFINADDIPLGCRMDIIGEMLNNERYKQQDQDSRELLELRLKLSGWR